jgi:hypothetical protein
VIAGWAFSFHMRTLNFTNCMAAYTYRGDFDLFNPIQQYQAVLTENITNQYRD